MRRSQSLRRLSGCFPAGKHFVPRDESRANRRASESAAKKTSEPSGNGLNCPFHITQPDSAGRRQRRSLASLRYYLQSGTRLLAGGLKSKYKYSNTDCFISVALINTTITTTTTHLRGRIFPSLVLFLSLWPSARTNKRTAIVSRELNGIRED